MTQIRADVALHPIRIYPRVSASSVVFFSLTIDLQVGSLFGGSSWTCRGFAFQNGVHL
jgi:hypothetical protein